MAGMAMEDCADVVRRERQLLDPAVRGDPVAAGRLMHPDFLEFGKSGRVWGRQSILARMTSDPQVSDAVSELLAQHLCDEVILLTYRSGDGALRSSVWVRDAQAGWLLRFHHGTPMAR